jgi:hypothetical protein
MRSVWTACRAGLLAAMVAGSLAVGVGAPAGAATTTIGQLGSNFECAANADFVQVGVGSGNTYTVPAGNWNVTSWSSQAGFGNVGAGSLQLEIWRATGTPDQFQLVGISPVGTTAATGTSTFVLAAPIAVQGGDLLGLRNLTQFYGCDSIGVGNTLNAEFNTTTPVSGDVRTLPSAGQSAALNIAATLEGNLPPVTTSPSTVPASPTPVNVTPAVVAAPTFTG